MGVVRSSSVAWAALQVVLVTAGLAIAVLAPPVRGTMLAISLDGAPAATTIDLALAQGATIEGMGPFRGSVMLRGERRRLFGSLRAHGIVLLAGMPRRCGR